MSGSPAERERAAVRWLIDGMNLIGSRPTGWWRARGAAMLALVAELERFTTATGDRVAVVFDSRPRQEPPAGAVTVGYAPAPGRDAADDEIVRIVERDADPASLRVVTSDSALAERVRSRGAVVEPAGRFRSLLDAQLGR